MPVVNFGRVLVADLGLRQWSVVIRTRTWASGEARVGQAKSDVDIALLPAPKVVEQPDGQTIVVGPITPKVGNVGYTPAQLHPPSSNAMEFYWLVKGPFASGFTSMAYVPVHIDTSKPFRYMVTCKALGRELPF